MDTTIQTYLSGSNVPVFVGFQRHHQRAAVRAGRLTVVGLVLLAASFACRIGSLAFS